MAREFSVGGDGLTLANQPVTLVFINPTSAPNPNIQILRMWASQAGTAVSEQERIQFEQQVSVFPTLVSATPRALKRGDATASIIVGGTAGAQGTTGINASAEGAGTKTVNWGDNFNNLNGYMWNATPREVVMLPAAMVGGVGLFLPAAPTSKTNWACGFNFSEDS